MKIVTSMKKRFLIIASVLTIVTFACKKENGTSTLHIRMTDAPTALEEVNVDLRQVNIKLEKDTNSWVSMNTTAGVYNLLEFQNGLDTLIAQGTFPEGSLVKEIRLVLGEENSIKTGGQLYPLTVPSGSESGLKIKIGKHLRSTFDSLTIDFDAALSIKQEGNGFKLRPVIRLK